MNIMNELKELMHRSWEDASLEERKEVCRNYNKYHNDLPQDMSFEELDASFTGSRWITIKYTFGVKPE